MDRPIMITSFGVLAGHVVPGAVLAVFARMGPPGWGSHVVALYLVGGGEFEVPRAFHSLESALEVVEEIQAQVWPAEEAMGGPYRGS